LTFGRNVHKVPNVRIPLAPEDAVRHMQGAAILSAALDYRS